jgi:hypothetical protein
MGGGDSGIHQTQIQCAAWLLSRGVSIDEVVAVLLAATKIAAGDCCKRWNWRIEERNIRKDYEGWLRKHPQEKPKPKPKLVKSDASKPSNTTTVAEPEQSGNVVKMPVITPAKESALEHIKLGRAVIAHIRDSGEELINTKGGSWFYSDGVWELQTDTKWLDVRIEYNCAGFDIESGNRLISETRNWILRQPELWRSGKLPWDQHGKIPPRSGLIDPKTGELEAARPDHFCTWRVEVDFDREAKCPW